jgi:hypothetical protein
MTENAYWLVALVTILALACAIAGAWVEHYLGRTKPTLPPPDKSCERDGSIQSFYRRNGVM